MHAADKEQACLSSRRAALTAKQLAAYQNLRSLKDKEAFEDVMRHAEAVGAVRLVWPKFHAEGTIERIDLVDPEALAGLLGTELLARKVEQAKLVLAERQETFSVLGEVFARWGQLKKVRDTTPAEANAWLDGCRVVTYCRRLVDDGSVESAVRDASARLFKDSKRIEKLIPVLDVLLTGSVDAEARPQEEVLQELGLFRETQPVRMAGNLMVRRDRGTFPLDRPYCALPATTILGLASRPTMVLTVENQTTFHAEARLRCDTEALCIYTGGMPSPSWRRMYVTLLRDLEPSVPVYHWGDIDEGGYRIAAFLARAAAEASRVLKPWRMHPMDVPVDQRREAKASTVLQMAAFARQAGWAEVAASIEECGFVAEQEGHGDSSADPLPAACVQQIQA